MSELHKACERGDLKEVTSLVSSKNINTQNRAGETPLYVATKYGDLNTVKVLMSRKECDFNIPDEQGNTPLHIACMNGPDSIVQFLTAYQRCQLNIQNRGRETPIHLASEYDTVRYLLSQKECDLNITNEQGDTPLHTACKNGHPSKVQFLVVDKRCQLNTQNSEMDTPLHIACRMKALRIIRLLLDRKCSTNIPNKKDETAERIRLNEDGDCLLHIACQWGDVDIVRFLITDQRCNPNIANASGNTPLHTACKHGHHSMVQSLVADKRCQLNIQNREGETPLHLASEFDAVGILISQKECDLNITNEQGDASLHTACKNGHYTKVQFLVVNKRCQLNTRNRAGETPLYIATKCGDLNTVQVLMSRKECDFNIPDKQGNTPLHIACMNGPDSIVQLIAADQRCQLNTQNREGETPLHLASEYDTVRVLLSQKECDLNITNEQGDTPLHTACKNGHHSKVQFLVADKRCQLNIQNREGETPLHLASKFGHHNTVKFLLSRKECDFNILDEHGNTPLHKASKYNHHIVVELLAVESDLRCQLNTQNREGETPLHLASEYDTVGILISQKECDLNITNEQGDAPLHTACKNGHHSKVQFLVADKRCQLNTQNRAGETPLYVATKCGGLNTVKVLMSRKECDFNIPDKQGNTPLHLACMYGPDSIVQLIAADQRCQLNTQNREGDTPLHLASEYDTVRVLLSQKECDLNITNEQGDTPLHTACKNGHHSKVQFLVTDKRCQLNIQNSEGETPLHLASKFGHHNTVKFLLSRKECDFNILDEHGNTPLHKASKYNHHIVVELLAVESDLRCQLNTQNREGDTPLHLASEYDTVGILISQKECDLNITNEQGDTPLHTACKNGHHSNVQFLVADKRCQLNTQNSEMDTPLHIACHMKALMIIRRLLDRKCRTNIPNNKGETAEEIPLNEDGDCLLHIACQWGDINMMRYLVTDQRCNPNVKNASSNTPLHIASSEHGHLEIVEVLVDRKDCDLNIANERGNTPLHSSCHTKALSIVQLLLRKKCSTTIPNKIGKTAQEIPLNEDGDYLLHIACLWGDMDMVKYLVTDQSCDPNILNKDLLTPLHATIKHGKASVATALLQHAKCDLSLHDQDGNTALHLACIRGQTEPEMVKVAKNLIISADPLCVNSAGQTPIELTTNYELIQAISHFTECKTKHSVQTYINLFIVGNPETGKSTLIKAVCKEASIFRRFLPKELRRVKNVPPHTAGIIPTTFRSKAFGNTVLYDLAGQIEYYTSHAAVIQTTVISTPPAFIIVVNISESEEKISETLRYWWSFINNHVARASAPPQVILVGSHADKLKARGGSAQGKMSQVSALLKRLTTSFYFAGQVALDCRDPASRKLQLFCSLVNKSCCELRQTADVDLRCHVLYAFLLEKFPGEVACTVSDMSTIIQESDALLPQNPDGLIPLISTLSDKGLLLLVRDSGSIEDSWIILQKQALLGEVNGTIFTPKHFSQHKKDLSSSTGVVPLFKLRNEFPDRNPTMIATFLAHLEFCFKVDDHETLKLLKDDAVQNMPQGLSEGYYFFPALVSVENPLQVWKQNAVMISQCGWFYRCIRNDQFLTTQFLHVLILRLAFSFALQLHPGDLHEESLALHRRCSVWKRGIGWLNRVPIETVVEVGLLNQSVIVIMRCPNGEEAKCVQLRSEVIQKVIGTKDELCKAVEMSESFVHPNDIKYPLIEHNEDLKYYSLTEIADATVKGANNVLDNRGIYTYPVKDLLLFDLQSTTSRELLRELFSEKHSLDEQVRGQVLEKLQEGEAVDRELLLCTIQYTLQSCRSNLARFC